MGVLSSTCRSVDIWHYLYTAMPISERAPDAVGPMWLSDKLEIVEITTMRGPGFGLSGHYRGPTCQEYMNSNTDVESAEKNRIAIEIFQTAIHHGLPHPRPHQQNHEHLRPLPHQPSSKPSHPPLQLCPILPRPLPPQPRRLSLTRHNPSRRSAHPPAVQNNPVDRLRHPHGLSRVPRLQTREMHRTTPRHSRSMDR